MQEITTSVKTKKGIKIATIVSVLVILGALGFALANLKVTVSPKKQAEALIPAPIAKRGEIFILQAAQSFDTVNVVIGGREFLEVKLIEIREVDQRAQFHVRRYKDGKMIEEGDVSLGEQDIGAFYDIDVLKVSQPVEGGRALVVIPVNGRNL